MSEWYKCPICLRVMYEPCTLPCGHSFCISCLVPYGKTYSNTCAICRKDRCDDYDLCPSRNLIDAIIDTQPDVQKEWEEREKSSKWQIALKEITKTNRYKLIRDSIKEYLETDQKYQLVGVNDSTLKEQLKEIGYDEEEIEIVLAIMYSKKKIILWGKSIIPVGIDENLLLKITQAEPEVVIVILFILNDEEINYNTISNFLTRIKLRSKLVDVDKMLKDKHLVKIDELIKREISFPKKKKTTKKKRKFGIDHPEDNEDDEEKDKKKEEEEEEEEDDEDDEEEEKYTPQYRRSPFRPKRRSHHPEEEEEEEEKARSKIPFQPKRSRSFGRYSRIVSLIRKKPEVRDQRIINSDSD